MHVLDARKAEMHRNMPFPTKPFTTLEPLNPSIVELYVAEKRQSTVLEATKLKNVRPGSPC